MDREINILPMKNQTHLNWTIFSIVVLLFGAAWIFVTAEFFPGSTTGFIPAPKEGFLAPGFSLAASNGETYQLSDFQGRVVLVNVWASWCLPCRAEMLAMQNVYEAYRDQGFTILAVNATHQDSLTAADEFATEQNLTFPILYDPDGIVTRAYQIHSFPSSFFIDQTGVIQEIIIGGPMAEALIQTRVENLLRGRQ